MNRWFKKIAVFVVVFMTVQVLLGCLGMCGHIHVNRDTPGNDHEHDLMFLAHGEAHLYDSEENHSDHDCDKAHADKACKCRCLCLGGVQSIPWIRPVLVYLKESHFMIQEPVFFKYCWVPSIDHPPLV